MPCYSAANNGVAAGGAVARAAQAMDSAKLHVTGAQMSCVRPETEKKTRRKGNTGLSLSAGRSRLPSTRASMFAPENVALAAHRLDPQDRGVVQAWVESGGDVNCHFDAANHGGTLNVHRLLTQVEDGGETLLFLVVYGDKISSPGGPFSKSDEERDCRDRLELIRYLLSRGADPNLGAADGSTSLHILYDDSRRCSRKSTPRRWCEYRRAFRLS